MPLLLAAVCFIEGAHCSVEDLVRSLAGLHEEIYNDFYG